jgi:hypothetical protein
LRAPVAYLGLALAVAAPLLGGGLVLAVDLALPPHPRLPSDYWGIPSGTHIGQPSRLALDALFVALGKVHAVALGEQLLLLAIVFLGGWGMHRAAPVRYGPARVYAGILYAVNPFVYDRLHAGQWFLLLGYALLPFAWSAFLRLLRGTGRDAPRFAALAAAVGIANAHMAVLLGVLCLVTVVAEALSGRTAAPARRAALGAGLFALLSLYWLVPVPGLTSLWDHVGTAQLRLYSALPAGRWGIGATLGGLGGFWNSTAPVSSFVGVWPAVAAAFVVLAALGLWARRRDPATIAVALAGVLGFLLALGYASSVTGGSFAWVLEKVPPARSFRESQKGLALVAFSYAFLGAAGVEWVRRRLHGRASAALAVVVALPLLLGFRTFDGLWGRLETSTFPASWSDARSVLAERGGQSRTLFAPWSGYIELSFAHYRLVANPAPSFFTTPILASSSVGAGQGVDDTSDPVEGQVASLLTGAAHRADFGACLARLGVGHVLVAHEIGALELDRRLRRGVAGVTLERSWPGLDLYRVDAPTGLVMESLGPGACDPVRPVRVTRRGPASYVLDRQVEPSSLVVGLPNPDEWTLSGRELRYRPWAAYRRNYALGVVGLVAFAAAALVLYRRRS